MGHLGGFWSTFGQLLAYAIETYDRGAIRRLRVLPVLGAVTQRVGSHSSDGSRDRLGGRTLSQSL